MPLALFVVKTVERVRRVYPGDYGDVILESFQIETKPIGCLRTGFPRCFLVVGITGGGGMFRVMRIEGKVMS